MQVHPQAAAAVADLDPQLNQVLLNDGGREQGGVQGVCPAAADEDPQLKHVQSLHADGGG